GGRSGETDRGVLVALAVEDRHLPDRAYEGRVRVLGQAAGGRAALLAVLDLDADLDQLVRAQRRLRLSDDAAGEPALPDADDGRERVGTPLQELALLRGEGGHAWILTEAGIRRRPPPRRPPGKALSRPRRAGARRRRGRRRRSPDSRRPAAGPRSPSPWTSCRGP